MTSFLAGRLASTEGAYFLQESKLAVGRLAQKLPPPSSPARNPSSSHDETKADVLHEILRHSIPIIGRAPPSESSLSTESKWVIVPRPGHHPVRANLADALNPLRAYVSLPQVTFGPRRWKLPDEYPSVSASTANELRRDRTADLDPKKLRDAAEGLSQIGKAYAIATVLVFGGATMIFVLTASKLQMHSIDIKTEGRDLLRPRFEMVKERCAPLRVWAEDLSKKFHFKGDGEGKEKTILKELSKTLGVNSLEVGNSCDAHGEAEPMIPAFFGAVNMVKLTWERIKLKVTSLKKPAPYYSRG